MINQIKTKIAKIAFVDPPGYRSLTASTIGVQPTATWAGPADLSVADLLLSVWDTAAAARYNSCLW